MTRLTLTMLAVAGVALSGATSLGCASTRTHESAGEFLDNSVITTKVKAALLAEPTLKSLQINVKSFKDVVQLSGFVDTAQARKRAEEVASAVQGVASVKNDLIVK
jgi:osmotically-inducible protein OsmY